MFFQLGRGRGRGRSRGRQQQHQQGAQTAQASVRPPPGPPIARIYLIRHGETNENRAGIIQGQMDTVLNEPGIEQAHICGQALKDIPFAAAFSSDLKRASKTAELILSYQSHPIQLVCDEGLREREMGALQGVLAGQYDKTKVYEGSESGEIFAQRVYSWWESKIVRLLSAVPQRSEGPVHILVVSHGAYISTLVRVLLTGNIIIPSPGVNLDHRYYNTSITTIDLDATGRGVLVKRGDISHLLVPKPSAPSESLLPKSAENADAEVMQDR